MGEAIARALLDKKYAVPAEILCCDTNEKNLQNLADSCGVCISSNCRVAAGAAQAVILAVKPRVVDTVADVLRDRLKAEQVLLSIAAGITVPHLMTSFGHSQVVRAMPNLAAQVGKSATVWTASPYVGAEQLACAESVFSTIGNTLKVSSEDLIDAATAISGSGPAYQYLFMEALADAGVRLGLSYDQAVQLTLDMVEGAVSLCRCSGDSFEQLRHRVTTPGGTTAAALHSFEKSGLRAAVSDAAYACRQRSIELAEN